MSYRRRKRSVIESVNRDVMLLLFDAVFSSFVRHPLPFSAHEAEIEETTMAMMLVSKSWHDIIMSHPSFWTRITFWASRNEVLEEGCLQEQVNRMRAHLVRSDTAPLDVFLGIITSEYDTFEYSHRFGHMVIELLKPHMPRIRNLSLHLRGYHTIWNILPLHLGPNSLLCTIDISIYYLNPNYDNDASPFVLVRAGRRPIDEPWADFNGEEVVTFTESELHRSLRMGESVDIISSDSRCWLSSISLHLRDHTMPIPVGIVRGGVSSFSFQGRWGHTHQHWQDAMGEAHHLTHLDLSRLKDDWRDFPIPSSVLSLCLLGKSIRPQLLPLGLLNLHLPNHDETILFQLADAAPRLRTLRLGGKVPRVEHLFAFLLSHPELTGVEIQFLPDKATLNFFTNLSSTPLPPTFRSLRIDPTKDDLIGVFPGPYVKALMSVLDFHRHLIIGWMRIRMCWEDGRVTNHPNFYEDLQSRYPGRFKIVDAKEVYEWHEHLDLDPKFPHLDEL